MTCDGSVKAPGVIEVRLIVIVVTWSAAIRVDSGMSVAATTTGPVVGAIGVLLSPSPFPRASKRIPTNAMIARKTPTSRTRRFERFKLVLPEELRCDRWHHSSTAQEPRDYTKGLG